MKKQEKTPKEIPATHNQSALLVIDVQQALFEKRIPIYQAETLLAKINRLVEQAHQAGVLVVYVQHSGKGDLARGEPGWQLHPAMQPTAGDVLIHKQHGNAFEGTELAQELDAHLVGKLLITGLVTHGCVKATCQGALDLGYQTTLVGDAHSSYSEKAAELIAELNQKMQEMGAILSYVEEVSF